MANLLDHALTLRSWPGRGSVFAVNVPLTPAQPTVAAPMETLAAQAGGAALIVDNEPQALAALKLLLESWGWRVICARDATQALAQVGAADVAIVDYHLDGGRTGLELYTMLHEARAELAAIILTADRDGALRRRIQNAGLVLLYKPLKPLALHQALLHLHSAAGVHA
jgi:CheY-like chemotaxis protein